MSTENNNNNNNKGRIREEKLDAKQKEIVENLDKASLKDVKESIEEAKILGDSDKEK
jgi:hypothetical protein